MRFDGKEQHHAMSIKQGDQIFHVALRSTKYEKSSTVLLENKFGSKKNIKKLALTQSLSHSCLHSGEIPSDEVIKTLKNDRMDRAWILWSWEGQHYVSYKDVSDYKENVVIAHNRIKVDVLNKEDREIDLKETTKAQESDISYVSSKFVEKYGPYINLELRNKKEI